MSEARLEEHFVLKVQDVELQEALAAILNQEDENSVPPVDLVFESERVGMLSITDNEGVKHSYAVTLHDLPTVVETFKSHNHVNLVKLSDIGQVLYVYPRNEATAEEVVAALKEQEAVGALPLEAEDGITMPMRNARGRVFRKMFHTDPELVQTVEDYLVSILNGEAPQGWRFEDVEETYVKDKKTGKGKWTLSSEVLIAAAKQRKPGDRVVDKATNSAVTSAEPVSAVKVADQDDQDNFEFDEFEDL